MAIMHAQSNPEDTEGRFVLTVQSRRDRGSLHATDAPEQSFHLQKKNSSIACLSCNVTMKSRKQVSSLRRCVHLVLILVQILFSLRCHVVLVKVVSSWLLIVPRLISVKKWQMFRYWQLSSQDLQFAARLQIRNSGVRHKMPQTFRSVCLNVHIHIDIGTYPCAYRDLQREAGFHLTYSLMYLETRV